MRTNVYVDGFNLYYGALRGTPYKWLDIRRMCELLLKKHTVAPRRGHARRPTKANEGAEEGDSCSRPRSGGPSDGKAAHVAVSQGCDLRATAAIGPS